MTYQTKFINRDDLSKKRYYGPSRITTLKPNDAREVSHIVRENANALFNAASKGQDTEFERLVGLFKTATEFDNRHNLFVYGNSPDSDNALTQEIENLNQKLHGLPKIYKSKKLRPEYQEQGKRINHCLDIWNDYKFDIQPASSIFNNLSGHDETPPSWLQEAQKPEKSWGLRGLYELTKAIISKPATLQNQPQQLPQSNAGATLEHK